MAMALTQDSLEIIRLLCDVTLRMIEGELYQLTKTGDVDITEDEHFEIIRRKTAFLFGGCAQIGGMLGGVTPEQETALREYGFNLGIAFQLVDDLLDYTADAAALGKPIGGDLREGKVTLPIIFLLRRGGEAADAPDSRRGSRSRRHHRAVAGDPPPAARAPLAPTRPTARALEYAARAKDCLSAFPAGRERDALMRADRLRARRAIASRITGPDMRTFIALLPARHDRGRRGRHHRVVDVDADRECREQRPLDGERRGGRDQGAGRRRRSSASRDGARPDCSRERRCITSAGPASREARHSRCCHGAGPQNGRDPDPIRDAVGARTCGPPGAVFDSAFPALGTGVGGFPVGECAGQMIAALRDHVSEAVPPCAWWSSSSSVAPAYLEFSRSL